MKERCTMDEAEHIVNTYADMVYKFALSLTRNKDQADDVFQNVFYAIVKHCQCLKMRSIRKRGFLLSQGIAVAVI